MRTANNFKAVKCSRNLASRIEFEGERTTAATASPSLPCGSEIGYRPFVREEPNPFLYVVAKCCKRASRALMSKLLLARWASAYADGQSQKSAVLDRLLHHMHIVQISGRSCRYRKNARLVRRSRGPRRRPLLSEVCLTHWEAGCSSGFDRSTVNVNAPPSSLAVVGRPEQLSTLLTVTPMGVHLRSQLPLDFRLPL